MSTYGVNINFKVVGQNKVDRAITSAKKLEASISRIRSIDLSKAVGGASGDRIAKALSQLRRYAQQVNQLGKTIGDTPAQQRAAANAFKEVANNAKVGSFTFEQFTKAAFKQSEGLKASEKAAENVIRRMKGMQTVEQRDAQIQRRAIKLRELRAKKERELAAAENKRRNRQTARNAASSAIIGGAFPLLFGQTGAAAVGGAIGGTAGGLLGGQFGFALSILGTAIGSAVDKNEKFNQSLAALNVQFNVTSGGTQILAADIDRLAKRLNVTKEEAIAALSAFKEFGSSSIAKSLVGIFGTDAGAFDTLAATNRQAALAKQIFEARKQIGNQVAKQLLQQNLVNDASVIELALAEARAKAANDELIAKAKVVTLQDRILAGAASDGFNFVNPSIFGEERAQKLQKEFEEVRNKRIKDFKKALEEVREMLGLVNEANGQFGQSSVLAFSTINDKVKDLQDEMKMLQDPIRLAINLSDVMGASFEESFKGIVKGTMTVADAFRSMLNRIADVFLDTAARMLANQFQQGILGLFGNLFSGFVSPVPLSDGTGAMVARDNRMYGNTFPMGSFANGGRPPVGRASIVGERGPELFVPDRAGTIIPNHAMGSSTNIVVNVDASGSSVEGDEQQGRQLGELISAAIQSELINQKRPGGLLS